ncbi:hypothetical protein TRFO_41226 [Tritrichomonas foetus]|uniref:Uncharacterized protein n=1 Tax=Tritrichomonas foetus TaxID=1144522 RepID=A0A1J4L0Z1_9EUKA|nr:hypothetical protein TRFO_41226 [Tritrichomonas foetus]|eukprot:OHT17183.1 hypothetical protein TRFO_41226 [Tritrichomonas foetus]
MSRLSASSRKQSSESVSSSYADTSIGSSSLVSSKNERLKFLRKSLLKRATTSFINLYSYLFSVLPIHSFIYDFMFCLRLIQLFVPSIFYANPVLYISGTPQYKVGVFLTIFTRLFPIGSDLDGQIIFGWIYVAFFIFYISCLSLCAYYFAKKSTLPSVVPSILCYTFTIVEHLPHCWAMSLLGYITSLDTDTLTNEQIALSFFLALTFVLFSVIHQMLNIASIFFTPLAFKTVNPWPQSTLTYITALICFISEFSGHYQKNKIVQIVLMVVVLLLYIFIFFLLETKAYFLNGFQGSTFCAVCDACIIFSVISIIYMIVEKPVHDFIFLIVSLSIILFTILNFQLRSRRFIKSLSILDYLEEDKSNYSMFKRSSQILPNIFIGFQTNHRYCLSYTIFRDSLNCFENDLSLLIAFAKLLAIYPEEYAQLNWVYAMLKRHPKSNFITKFIKAQLMTILMRRESTLSGDLKKKLQSISHLVSTAKLRIRNMWEAVLSGTISELEPLFLSYSTIVKQIDLKFTYLQNYHSNNQFALRALSNYERDVQANIELANYHREKVKKIKMGHTDDIDQVYLYGRIMFPMLPPRPIYQNFKTTEVHSLQNIADGESSIGSISDASINEDDEHLYIADVQTRLRNTITSMSIPSIRVSITLTFLLIFIIMLVPYIVILVMLNPIETMISDPVSYLTSIDKVHKYVLHIYGLTIRYIMESEPFNLIDLCEYFVDWEDDGGVPENIGGQCASNHMLLYFAQEATVAIGELSEMKKDKSTNEILINVKNILFKNITTFQVFTEFAVAGPPVNKSIQQYVIDSVETAIMIASDDSPFKYSTSREIVNLLINAFSFEASTLELTDDILEYLIDHTNQIKKIFTILEYTLAILFPILFLVVSAILARWVRIQKRKVYRCFYALPKTTLSKMIEAYNSTVSVDKNVNNSNAEAELEEERQEEKAITILRSGDIGNKMSRLVGIAIIGILIVLFNIVFIIYGCQYFIKNAQLFIYSSPLINYISYAYTNSFTSLLFLTIKAWKDNGFNHPAIPDAFLINYYLTKINDTTTYYNKMFYGNTNENIYTAAKFIDEF